MPFCWQDKSVLRKINLEATRKEISAIRNCYVALTEIASNQENEKISIFLFDIAKISGLSEKTVSKCLDFLVGLWVVYMKPQERWPDGRYQNKEIWLVSWKDTVGKLKKSSKKVWGKLKKSSKKVWGKLKKSSVSKLSDNIESNIEDNIESNIEQSMCVGGEEKKQTPSTHKNVDFINGMRDVEVRWANWLTQWNTLTSREDVMNSWIKKELFWIMKNVSLEVFKERVEKFREILQIIEDKKLRPMMYFPIWERDFENFVKNINKFYWENSIVFGKLCHLQMKAKVIREINKKDKAQEEGQTTTQEEKKPLTEEERRKAVEKLQKAKMSLKK